MNFLLRTFLVAPLWGVGSTVELRKMPQGPKSHSKVRRTQSSNTIYKDINEVRPGVKHCRHLWRRAEWGSRRRWRSRSTSRAPSSWGKKFRCRWRAREKCIWKQNSVDRHIIGHYSNKLNLQSRVMLLLHWNSLEAQFTHWSQMSVRDPR